ncbi:MAG TPA: methylmalonyl Co-A mutase-associated GTPase MeaB, partial [candidate division Zixibacteria bacterium]|nr:methylmalonyl Co-A mutase-associated GTPase MeaB [candidate division Zixibacteria bacterium]
MTTLERFQQGDISALARIITHVENRQPGYRELLSRLYRFDRKAVRIGLTGPPGAGKSTLVDCLSRRLTTAGKKVAVVAVDPSSPFTGGALLGDRVRYHEDVKDGSHFFRSMATRGSQGGLSGATDNVALVLDAFGFDFILIETVGVGQVELDIVDNCDLVVVILVPESGDAVQTLKAGLTEIADIFVVNKSDR